MKGQRGGGGGTALNYGKQTPPPKTTQTPTDGANGQVSSRYLKTEKVRNVSSSLKKKRNASRGCSEGSSEALPNGG